MPDTPCRESSSDGAAVAAAALGACGPFQGDGCAACTDEIGRVERNHCKAAIRGGTEINPSCMDNEVMAYQKETFNYICSDRPFISLLC